MSRARPLDLARVPTDDDLSRMYYELARRGASTVGRRARWPYTPRSDEELLALGAQMSRHDARLLGALVELCLRGWRELSPVKLRAAMSATRCPQALCVVVDFARDAARDRELTLWARHVTADWPRVDPAAHFFVDDVRPGERMAARRLGRSLALYSRWGFRAVERPTIDPHRKTRVGRYDAETRRAVLDGLLARGEGVSVSELLAALDHSISRQQALVDLRAAGLVPSRRGPGARWSRRARRRRTPDSP